MSHMFLFVISAKSLNSYGNLKFQPSNILIGLSSHVEFLNGTKNLFVRALETGRIASLRRSFRSDFFDIAG
jgi:hypothetical protein